jgi:Na+-transporting methylmalonyl-CoA/oxaloacetate decarboxylase gamma subunit
MRILIEIFLFLIIVAGLLYVVSRLFPQYFKPFNSSKTNGETKTENNENKEGEK